MRYMQSSLRKMKILPILALVSLSMAGTLMAEGGPFVPPAEGPVPFRRDKVPLDPDTMSALSGQLVTLVGGVDLEGAEGRRASAQLLALALALDPANKDARETLEVLEEGDLPTFGDERNVERAKARVWTTLSWLEDPESGKDGHSLGACLGDVMIMVDPDHPRAKVLAAKGERGSWSGWVAGLRDFDDKAIVKNVDPEEDEMDVRDEDSDEVDEPGSGSSIRLEAATVQTPLWNYDKVTDKTSLRVVPVTMAATMREVDPDDEDDQPRPFGIRLENTEEAEFLSGMNEAILGALEKIHGPLPKNGRVRLTVGKDSDYLVRRNRQAISAAAAVLADAALSGIAPNATVIGIVDEKGGFKLPPRFWEKLRALSNGPGGRLVLPAQAAEYLPSLLALEQSDFFFKYEVLLASNLKELIQRSSGSATGEVADVSVKFAEIRSRLGAQTVPLYVSNSFVRQRLAAIAQEAPHHFSARMLAIQGAGERPTILPRNILAAELRTAIEAMAWIAHHQGDRIDSDDLDRTYGVTRADVDALERYVDLRDRDFHEKVRALTISVRTLARDSRSMARVREDEVPRNLGPAIRALGRDYSEMVRVLSEAAGDEEELPRRLPRD